MLFGLLFQVPFELFKLVLIAVDDGEIQIDVTLNVWIVKSRGEL